MHTSVFYFLLYKKPLFSRDDFYAAQNEESLHRSQYGSYQSKATWKPCLHGVPVGHVRKFDSRLRIEFLRAYMPDRFKTPGTPINIDTKGDVFVLTEEQRHELIAINREFLLDPSTLPVPQVGAAQA